VRVLNQIEPSSADSSTVLIAAERAGRAGRHPSHGEQAP
jgi:hypothetical protein